MVLTQRLVRPLRRLTTMTERFAAGDFGQRGALTQRDEIGRLAQSFNIMAGALEERINAEQAARAEADRLQQAETHSRWQLEHMVDRYLLFAQHVARGDLTQRLEISGDSAMEQLGAGLNQMVQSLQASKDERERQQLSPKGRQLAPQPDTQGADWTP